MPSGYSGTPLVDITEDVIRDVALPMHLVDVKVCSVDDIWSGLKLVIRRAPLAGCPAQPRTVLAEGGMRT